MLIACYSKNKFENLVRLVGSITSIYYDARSSECQNSNIRDLRRGPQ